MGVYAGEVITDAEGDERTLYVFFIHFMIFETAKMLNLLANIMTLAELIFLTLISII